jgi:hypothetical protein
MKISEKQILQLMIYVQMFINSGEHLEMRKKACDLLNIIQNQQPEELKEIK